MPSVREELEGFVAGRVKAERVVEVVAAAYYGEQGAGSREQLRPIIEVIERAHPGVVELAATAERPGFAVRLSERPFPKRYESDLRTAVSGVVTAPTVPPPAPGLLNRIIRAIRRVFSA